MPRRPEPAFPVVGKLGEQQLETVHALCRPGEQPAFVIAEGIYGILAAFEDRLAIIKKGAMTAWLSGARGEGLQRTFRYAEIDGIRFVARKYYGTLEIVPLDDDDPGGELSLVHTDPQKRDDAIELSLRLYEQAYAQLDWLRDRIREVRHGAQPALAVIEQLERLRAEELGLDDPEPFATALAEAVDALKGHPRRLRGVPVGLLEELADELAHYCGVTVPHTALAEILAGESVVGLAMAWGASDEDVREQLADVLARELAGLDEWPHDSKGHEELHAAARRRGWTTAP